MLTIHVCFILSTKDFFQFFLKYLFLILLNFNQTILSIAYRTRSNNFQSGQYLDPLGFIRTSNGSVHSKWLIGGKNCPKG